MTNYRHWIQYVWYIAWLTEYTIEQHELIRVLAAKRK
jgi:hypothetical protein